MMSFTAKTNIPSRNLNYQMGTKFLIKLTLLISAIILIKSQQEKEQDDSLHTITKSQFIEYYNKFFVENNPLPEISELYKENPDFFRLLAAKLVETLPEKFPINMIQKIFDKDRILQAVEEMKARNMTVEQYNEEKRKSIEEAIRQKEIEELKKKEELEKQEKSKQEKKVLNGGNFENFNKGFYVSMILNNAWALESISTKEDQFFKSLFDETILEVAGFLPEEFTLEQFDEMGKKAEEHYKRLFKTSVRRKLEKKFKTKDAQHNERLEKLLKEIDNQKISFKNLKSNFKLLIEEDESVKDVVEEHLKDEENKKSLFSLESQIIVEDL